MLAQEECSLRRTCAGRMGNGLRFLYIINRSHVRLIIASTHSRLQSENVIFVRNDDRQKIMEMFHFGDQASKECKQFHLNANVLFASCQKNSFVVPSEKALFFSLLTVVQPATEVKRKTSCKQSD